MNLAAWLGHAGCMVALVRAGADVNGPGPEGVTPLHVAASRGHAETVATLARAGADVDAAAGQWLTPVHTAAGGGHARALLALLRAGADATRAAPDGGPPIAYSCIANDLYTARGRDPDAHLPDAIAALARAGADLNAEYEGSTPLLAAVRATADTAPDPRAIVLATVRALVHGGARVDARALTLAARLGSPRSKGAAGPDLFEALGDAGADVDAAGGDARRALHVAAAGGNVGDVEALLRMGADAHRPDASGVTPVALAAFFGRQEVVRTYVKIGKTRAVGPGGGGPGVRSPLWWAAAGGDPACVDALAALGTGGMDEAIAVARAHGQTRAAEALSRHAGGGGGGTDGAGPSGAAGEESEAPADYICPITRQLMRHPVITADGHSYERKAIKRWFNQSNRSPKTNTQLRHTKVVPNHALKAIIDEWREANNVEADGGGGIPVYLEFGPDVFCAPPRRKSNSDNDGDGDGNSDGDGDGDGDLGPKWERAPVDLAGRTKLFLGGFKLLGRGAAALAGAARRAGTLTSLELFDCGLGETGARAVAGLLGPEGKLERLGLNGIGDEGVGYIADALGRDGSLVTLDLACGGLRAVAPPGALAGGKGGAPYVVNKDDFADRPEWAPMAQRPIGSRGCSALATALARNTALRELCLYNNTIGDAGAVSLADSLRKNRTLRALNLGQNGIGGAGIVALAGALGVAPPPRAPTTTDPLLGSPEGQPSEQGLAGGQPSAGGAFGSTAPGGAVLFGATQPQGRVLVERRTPRTRRHRGSRGVTYAATPGMHAYQAKSFEEIRWEDYQDGVKGRTGGAIGSPPAAPGATAGTGGGAANPPGGFLEPSNATLEDLDVASGPGKPPELVDDAMHALRDLLACSTALRRLKVDATGPMAAAVAAGLASNEGLRTLELGVWDASADGARALGDAIRVHATLRHLRVHGVRALGARGACGSPGMRPTIPPDRDASDGVSALLAAVARPSPDGGLEVLDFAINEFSAKIDLDGLARGLASNARLAELKLNEGWSSFSGTDALGAALGRSPSLRRVAIMGRLPEGAVAAMAAGLRQNRSLEALDLFQASQSGDGDADAAALAAALASNGTLARLNLRGCGVGCDGAEALAGALASNARLRELCLAGNNIGLRGLGALARALEGGARLHGLDVRGQFSDEIRHVAFYELHSGLKGLAAGHAALLAAAQRHASLRSLQLDSWGGRDYILQQYGDGEIRDDLDAELAVVGIAEALRSGPPARPPAADGAGGLAAPCTLQEHARLDMGARWGRSEAHIPRIIRAALSSPVARSFRATCNGEDEPCSDRPWGWSRAGARALVQALGGVGDFVLSNIMADVFDDDCVFRNPSFAPMHHELHIGRVGFISADPKGELCDPPVFPSVGSDGQITKSVPRGKRSRYATKGPAVLDVKEQTFSQDLAYGLW